MESLDTMIDGTFPIAEWDLALLQMSEGTQGARTLTLHPPLPGNFSHHLTLSETSVRPHPTCAGLVQVSADH